MLIRKLKNNYQLILCKVNGKKIGKIPANIISITKGIEKVSEMTFSVSKYYGVNNEINYLYDELKTERMINLDEEESYVIKEIKEDNETIKTVTAYSREKKLYKNNVDSLDDMILTLLHPYEDVPDCFSLNEILYDQTGWEIGYVSDSVLYNEGTSDEKLRYQESITTNWYDFITNDISEQFECYPIFDSYNKIVNLYSEVEIGSNLNLMLSYDNYLKSVETTSDTEDIVTKLTLEGNEEIDIAEVNPSGYRFIEDYSYFIENEEMTDSLILALKLYDKMVAERSVQWKELKEQRAIKQKEYYDKQVELKFIYAKIGSLKMAIDMSTDEFYKGKLTAQLADEYDKQGLLEPQVDSINAEIKLLNEAILNINILCRKETATDNNGTLIFSEELLDELKEYIYQDTFSNDSFIEAEDLLQAGKVKIKELCKPTKTWSIDSVNFINKLIDNEFRQQWDGEIGLGDVILLKGKNTVEAVYLVEYSQDFTNGSLELTLSNKKSNKEFSLSIGQRLTQAKESWKQLKSKQYLLNGMRFNRIGLNFDKINKKIR